MEDAHGWMIHYLNGVPPVRNVHPQRAGGGDNPYASCACRAHLRDLYASALLCSGEPQTCMITTDNRSRAWFSTSLVISEFPAMMRRADRRCMSKGARWRPRAPPHRSCEQGGHGVKRRWKAAQRDEAHPRPYFALLPIQEVCVTLPTRK
ncbi:hypothetical protein OH76DRAFT_978186 [Lentinus brumalis]|uniref:Uncharacterized protein n=1 Tax=Lentinus brumalis TaxID=2498619 RepID=A0A371DPW7_9APHY|nr:hypothetical protein OH76DRAFT_978186 [Polyporus brumalis]